MIILEMVKSKTINNKNLFLRRQILLWHKTQIFHEDKKHILTEYSMVPMLRNYVVSWNGWGALRLDFYKTFGWEGLVTGSKARQFF